MTLLDTSSLVHLLRRKGDPAVKERVNSILLRGDAAICDMVEVELWMGVATKEDEKDVVELSALLVSLPIDQAVWQRAKGLAAACRKAGTPVPASDSVIAACAFVHGTGLDYEDEHFRFLEKLR
ncbi:MAG TPA: PIN domain-containing protein [Chthoniobacteraceae bacterium]|nr:PIN domain-containing protein [Chthoniobacteraceae bacterium]